LLVPIGALRADAGDDALLVRMRQGGLLLMIRHAEAPGTYDPPQFRIDDCASQRNLSLDGRAEASRLGAAFRRLKIPVSQVLSSEWCRCRDTAQLAFGGYVSAPMLNSLSPDSNGASRQIGEMRAAAGRVSPGSGANVVWVTHSFNIQPFAGVMVATTDVVVLRPVAPDRLELAGVLHGLGRQ
jgi:phosphohistidine phosphatase SixA